MNCTNCGKPILTTNEAQRYRFKKTGRIFCQKSCGYQHRDRERFGGVHPVTKKREPAVRPPKSPAKPKPEPLVADCFICGKPADLSKHRRSQFLKTGRAYCSTECSLVYPPQRSSETMSRTNLKYAS